MSKRFPSSPPRPAGAVAPPPVDEAAAHWERLQKVLASAGLGSRRACEELITSGRVEVAGQIVTKLGTKVDPTAQEIRVDGEPLPKPKLRYFIVNKPLGVVTTNSDPAGRTRVIDLIRSDARLFPVGRLDKSSEGLIIVTNDGELANLLAHPRYGVEKTYLALVAGEPNRKVFEQLQAGVHLAEGWAHAKSVRIKAKQAHSTLIEMVLDEGRNREVRRLFARVGHKVLRLQRVAQGNLRLGPLAPGEYRPLTREEVAELKSSALESIKQERPKRRANKKPASPAAGELHETSGVDVADFAEEKEHDAIYDSLADRRKADEPHIDESWNEALYLTGTAGKVISDEDDDEIADEDDADAKKRKRRKLNEAADKPSGKSLIAESLARVKSKGPIAPRGKIKPLIDLRVNPPAAIGHDEESSSAHSTDEPEARGDQYLAGFPVPAGASGEAVSEPEEGGPRRDMRPSKKKKYEVSMRKPYAKKSAEGTSRDADSTARPRREDGDRPPRKFSTRGDGPREGGARGSEQRGGDRGGPRDGAKFGGARSGGPSGSSGSGGSKFGARDGARGDRKFGDRGGAARSDTGPAGADPTSTPRPAGGRSGARTFQRDSAAAPPRGKRPFGKPGGDSNLGGQGSRRAGSEGESNLDGRSSSRGSYHDERKKLGSGKPGGFKKFGDRKPGGYVQRLAESGEQTESTGDKPGFKKLGRGKPSGRFDKPAGGGFGGKKFGDRKFGGDKPAGPEGERKVLGRGKPGGFKKFGGGQSGGSKFGGGKPGGFKKFGGGKPGPSGGPKRFTGPKRPPRKPGGDA